MAGRKNIYIEIFPMLVKNEKRKRELAESIRSPKTNSSSSQPVTVIFVSDSAPIVQKEEMPVFKTEREVRFSGHVATASATRRSMKAT
ncbi:hypothetical protein AVEN_84638-1 [Araneus ventricosus]|uniref:Uncharacterized protein n=1 Tax=Araneus ventricosus TaxID=182803 RepID=A0A4Y2XCJ4_ARAVE|nr:hypothetical protein AVEN_33118-1 [Araneus ventricosus]GBO45927.1 hypothetical protein AVEN_160197-1 [Araneus ventricosus]GBO45959.1 hypothetical protein AVEN_84638-1 [Araneus ventricosus]